MADKLETLRRKPARLVLGLNSGTSMDGVDALLARIFGSGGAARIEVLAFEMTSFGPELRERLLRAPAISCEEACRLHSDLARVFADAGRRVIAKAGGPEIDLVGSHGQTICHLPGRGGAPTATLQIGDLDGIAAELGVPVVGDFRAADAAAGGQGAPLMPYLDRVLFRGRPGTLTLNLGGITCVAHLPADSAGTRAFDVGPCNVTLDLLAAAVTQGEKREDTGGALALRGRVDPGLLAKILAHPFLREAPPKTSGREEFGDAYVQALLRDASESGVAPLDVLATHTAAVGASIAEAVDRWIAGGRGTVTQVVAGGGGVHNAALMKGVTGAFAGVPVLRLSDFGIDPDAKEAMLFALLANDRLFGLATNLPAITGAARAVPLGKFAGI